MKVYEALNRMAKIDWLLQLNAKILNTDYEFSCLGELYYPKTKNSITCDKNCTNCLAAFLHDDVCVIDEKRRGVYEG